jgi:hypothetical protein
VCGIRTVVKGYEATAFSFVAPAGGTRTGTALQAKLRERARVRFERTSYICCCCIFCVSCNACISSAARSCWFSAMASASAVSSICAVRCEENVGGAAVEVAVVAVVAAAAAAKDRRRQQFHMQPPVDNTAPCTPRFPKVACRDHLDRPCESFS